MPLKLVPPRPGKTPYWYVRGTYLGRYVDTSARTPEKRVAAQELRRIKTAIEEGRFAERGEATFLTAAVAYMEAGGERRPYVIEPLVNHFKERALSSVDQAAIDEAALAIYPTATNATRNRQVYTPVSAILKHAGIEYKVRRPKDAQGKNRTEWLWPEQAFALFNAADEVDKELGVLLRLLCYTGMRLGEALSLRCIDVRLDEGFAYVKDTKNDDPRPVFLPVTVVDAITRHPRGHARGTGRLFRFTKSGRLYALLNDSRGKAGGAVPEVTFHTLRHTWATWMRRYGGLDTRGLIGTGAWRDPASVRRYEHVVATEEAGRASRLPVEETWTRVGDKGKDGASD